MGLIQDRSEAPHAHGTIIVYDTMEIDNCLLPHESPLPGNYRLTAGIAGRSIMSSKQRRTIMLSMMIRAFGNRRGLVLFGLIAAALLYQFGCAPASYDASAGMEESNDDVHYLAAYGQWEDISPFGMVWFPHVVSEWAPFYYGHWIWTPDGWAWVSYEPFGWLVYHYGYWDYQAGIGWFWIPGDAWSPAQVEWYSFGDYCAWAPIPPPNVFWPDPWSPFDVNVWIVVDIDRFTDENVGRYRIAKPISRGIIGRESIVKRPPGREQVESIEKKTLPVVRIQKRPVDIRPQAPAAPRDSLKPKNPRLQRMVLPKAETRTVKKYAPVVEREVLAPKNVPPPSPPPEKSSEEAPKKKPVRR
jgi:hypothetical protein